MYGSMQAGTPETALGFRPRIGRMMAMDFATLWAEAQRYDEFVAGSNLKHRGLWEGLYRLARIPDWALAAPDGGPVKLLAIAEDWCGDASNTLPVLARLVEVAPGQSFVLVDIPGLIEGAAEGKGLGHQFLRHVERSFCLAYVLDSSAEDAFSQYQVLRSEMEKFHPLLLQKPRLIVLNKRDLGDFPIDPRFGKEGCTIIRTSAVTGEGLADLKQGIRELIGEKGIRKQGW